MVVLDVLLKMFLDRSLLQLMLLQLVLLLLMILDLSLGCYR